MSAFIIDTELEQAINEFAENGNWSKADRIGERIAERACNTTAETEFLVLPTESHIEYIEKCFNAAFDTYGPFTLTCQRTSRGGVMSKVALYARNAGSNLCNAVCALANTLGKMFFVKKI